MAATMPGSFILQSGDTPKPSWWGPGSEMTNGPKGQGGNSREGRRRRRKAICKIRNLPWQTGLALEGLSPSNLPPWGSCRIHLAPATFDYFYDQMAFYCHRLLSISGSHPYIDYRLLSYSRSLVSSGAPLKCGTESGFLRLVQNKLTFLGIGASGIPYRFSVVCWLTKSPP